MSLTASMYTGVTGLLAHGDKMNVLGNNIANVNTVGFKGSTMHFEDFFSQDVSTTAANFGQVGRGVSVAAVYGDFSQGAFETTNEATDLAIGGRGFFQVKVPNEDSVYYTRAGNFRFDSDGYLVDPHGYVLQGWEIPTRQANVAGGAGVNTATTSAIRGEGVPTDIRLDGFTADPQHTSNVTVITNLNSTDGGDNTVSATGNPFFALFEAYNANDPLNPGLPETAYAYQNTIKVFDEGGTAHNLTVYYDQVTVSNSGGKQYWEYVVAIDPTEDLRSFNGVPIAGTSGAGLLMSGTMTFDSSGQLEDMSAFTLGSNANPALGFNNLNNWVPTTFSTNGYPLLTANFSGTSNASYVASQLDVNTIPMEINFGISNRSGQWQGTPVANAAAVASNATALPTFGTQAEIESLATTSFAGSSSTLFQSQDGYTFGFLQTISVDRDGILQGRYSNGVTLELYQITLYDFNNKTGLRREGGNLFSETRESGNAFPGPANANGLGAIASNSLELSNVDLSREFVGMITTQRGFQANGKVITTTDQMLAEVVQLKR